MEVEYLIYDIVKSMYVYMTYDDEAITFYNFNDSSRYKIFTSCRE